MYWKLDNKYIVYVRNLTAYLESTPMNYPRHQISIYFGQFLMSYGYCIICATCAISGTSGRNTYEYNDMIRNLL